MSSFLINPVSPDAEFARIIGSEAQHAIRVMRVRSGDAVRLFDGAGMSFRATVSDTDRESVTCAITERLPESGEPTVKVTLAAAVIKTDRFESLVEKATELGVDAVWPLESDNSVVRAPSDNKRRRWRAIAESAAGQCLRSRIPQIVDPQTLDGVIARRSEFDAAFVAWERQTTGSLDTATLDSCKRILLVVGPEGGFTSEEIARLESVDITPVTLGARRLRTETAAIALLTLTMQRAGEFSRTAYGAYSHTESD